MTSFIGGTAAPASGEDEGQAPPPRGGGKHPRGAGERVQAQFLSAGMASRKPRK